MRRRRCCGSLLPRWRCAHVCKLQECGSRVRPQAGPWRRWHCDESQRARVPCAPPTLLGVHAATSCCQIRGAQRITGPLSKGAAWRYGYCTRAERRRTLPRLANQQTNASMLPAPPEHVPPWHVRKFCKPMHVPSGACPCRGPRRSLTEMMASRQAHRAAARHLRSYRPCAWSCAAQR